MTMELKTMTVTVAKEHGVEHLTYSVIPFYHQASMPDTAQKL